MPKLDIGKDYWFISDDDYDALVTFFAENESEYSMDSFQFLLHSNDNGYQGYFAEYGEIDDDEWLFLTEELGLESFGPITIFLSVQASYVG